MTREEKEKWTKEWSSNLKECPCCGEALYLSPNTFLKLIKLAQEEQRKKFLKLIKGEIEEAKVANNGKPYSEAYVVGIETAYELIRDQKED